MMISVLLRVAYLAVTNVFALLRWGQTCRPEFLDRTLIWNQRHLLHAFREFEHFYNEHRPHRTLQAAAPVRRLPGPIADPERIAQLDIRRRDRLGGILHENRHAA